MEQAASQHHNVHLSPSPRSRSTTIDPDSVPQFRVRIHMTSTAAVLHTVIFLLRWGGGHLTSSFNSVGKVEADWPDCGEDGPNASY